MPSTFRFISSTTAAISGAAAAALRTTPGLSVLPPPVAGGGAGRCWSGLAAGWACADGPSVTPAAAKPTDMKNNAKSVDRTSLSMIPLPNGGQATMVPKVPPLTTIVAFPKRRCVGVLARLSVSIGSDHDRLKSENINPGSDDRC